jgi:hypothetical protein
MRSFILVSAFLALCTATPLNRRYVVKETHQPPPEFTLESDAPQEHLIRLQVGLKQNRFDELERHLYEGILECLYTAVFTSDFMVQSPTRIMPATASTFLMTR